MRQADIVIGNKYVIVGKNGGCTTQQCKDCPPFKKGIIITAIYKNAAEGSRNISGHAIRDEGQHCNFNPADLRPFKMCWKKYYAENQKNKMEE